METGMRWSAAKHKAVFDHTLIPVGNNKVRRPPLIFAMFTFFSKQKQKQENNLAFYFRS
jgi:hypothetical protein